MWTVTVVSGAVSIACRTLHIGDCPVIAASGALAIATCTVPIRSWTVTIVTGTDGIATWSVAGGRCSHIVFTWTVAIANGTGSGLACALGPVTCSGSVRASYPAIEWEHVG